MIYAFTAGVLLAIIALGQLRVWRTEQIRLKCVELANESRAYHGRVYSHAEKSEVLLARAITFENYVRGIKPKKDPNSPAPRPPDPPPPPKL